MTAARGRCARAGAALAACAAVLAVTPAPASAAARDDTEALQARLDAGGRVFLPKLPDGKCYATRGLWVSRDDTTISSDGACIVALGPGEARLGIGTPHPVRATAVFFLNHSNVLDPQPVRVSISGLRITVPAARKLVGIGVFGHETTVSNVTIDGAPTVDVLVGSGTKKSSGISARVAILGCHLSGGVRDVVEAFGPIGLRVEDSTLSGARGGVRGTAAAGVHVQAADRGQPALDVHVLRNTVSGNAGPGVLLDLDPPDGPALFASGLEVSGNRVLGNARAAPPAQRGGIVVAGGQLDGQGTLTLAGNVVRGNRGPGLLARRLRLAVAATGNELAGNRGGGARGLQLAPARPSRPQAPWTPPAPGGTTRDDTDVLQRRLDSGGGTIFLPKLPGGECYATRGLWVSHDDTTIDSDGACIVSLGPGEVRLRSIDGDPIASSGVFYVNRSTQTGSAPVGVTIRNLRIVVPSTVSMYGIVVFGHGVTLSHLDIGGFPRDDVLIGGRANGNGYAGRVAVLDSTLSGANRNAISAFGVLDLRIERNVIQGVRDSPPGQPAAGIDVEPDDRAQPTLGVRIAGNRIQDNAGPGVLLSLDSNSGPAAIATGLEVSGNTVVRNAWARTPPTRAGVVVSGGEDGGRGTLALRDNVIRDNGGPGILTTALKLLVDAGGNDLANNEAGPTAG